MSKKITEDAASQRFDSKYSDWSLIKFTSIKQPCIVKHKCGKEKQYSSFEHVFLRGPFCDECDNIINWKYDIGDKLDDIEIIDRKIIQKEKKSDCSKNKRTIVNKKYYQYKCLRCGFDGSKKCYKNGEILNDHWVVEDILFNGGGCACCHGTVVQTGINDVATTDFDVVKFFIDKTIATKYSRSSTKKITTVCPDCGFIRPVDITIYNLVWEGTSCLKCGSSISYPEKIMYFVLKQLDVEFQMHKTFEWSKNIKNTYNSKIGDKQYDFYLPNHNLIIEMHGNQHYDSGTPFSVYGERGRTLREEQENDKLKYNLAIQHGYNYLVIDCRQSNFKYILNNIMSSNLVNYISLDRVDWNKCNRDALNGIKMLVIINKKENPNLSTADLAKKYNVTSATISNWLKQGADICGYNPDDEIKKSWVYAGHFTPVFSKELNMAFKLIKEAAEYVGIKPVGISKCASNKAKHAGKHPVTGERLTWERWTLNQYEEWCKTNDQSLKSLCNFTN